MSDQTTVTANLSAMGNVADRYVHRDKFIKPDGYLALPGACLKWYNVAPSDAPVPPEIHRLASAFVEREAAATLDVAGDLGFVILHRCGEAFYFLLVMTWRNENELWESVYAKDGSGQPDFQPFQFQGTHRGTFCVWELGAVWHEQGAWKRYLLSAREEEDKLVYLRDCYEGPV